MDKYTLYNNEELEQYEYHIGDFTPHISYRMKDGDIYLTHTRMPDQLQGKGIGKRLVEDVLNDISYRGIKLVPLCAFVASYIRKNPRWLILLKKGIYIG
ncbi:MAG: N-acetyltransferase [Prevotella sp.]|jgi:predicted GNAT family acetyltransferase|nr:N-acetyltransferase [Prevotella sp.]